MNWIRRWWQKKRKNEPIDRLQWWSMEQEADEDDYEEEKSKKPVINFTTMSQDELMDFFVERFDEVLGNNRKHRRLTSYDFVSKLNLYVEGDLIVELHFEDTLQPWLLSQGYISRLSTEMGLRKNYLCVEIFYVGDANPKDWNFVV